MVIAISDVSKYRLLFANIIFLFFSKKPIDIILGSMYKVRVCLSGEVSPRKWVKREPVQKENPLVMEPVFYAPKFDREDFIRRRIKKER